MSLIPVTNLPPVSFIPAAISPPMSLTPVANLPPVSLIPVVNLELRISPRIFEKIRNGPKNLSLKRGKIALSSDGLLQPQPEPAVGPLEFVPDEVAVDIRDGCDQELLLSVGGLFTSLRNATQKIDQ